MPARLRATLIAFGLGASAMGALAMGATRRRSRFRGSRRAPAPQRTGARLGAPLARPAPTAERHAATAARSAPAVREPPIASRVWTPERLRALLHAELTGERVVVVANREPYIHERDERGGVQVVHPASGLVTALEPVMRACSGVWVAHGGGSADRATVDAHDRVRVPPGEESYVLKRVWLSEVEERRYYYGFSNEGLWPLCHVAHRRPVFREEDWEEYRRVNARFARAVIDEVEVEDPIVLVQDYHFALAPKLIRAELPHATILTFWHIPWPNAERFGICPWRTELLEGLLGSSILGFHTRKHCNNFLDAADVYVETRIDREENAVVQHGRSTLVRPYPISIEWPVRWLDELPSPEACRKSLLEELGLPEQQLLGVGVDRLDYTKGIEERLLAVDELFSRYPEFRGRFTFVQLAAPSRTRIAYYRDLGERVEELARRINDRWRAHGSPAIVLLRAHHEPPIVYRTLRAADVCYVSSLHDGMNLVAKEFVAARDDERGVLVLSEFTGAARELLEALIVNPYDLRAASTALAVALKMPPEEQACRMRAMRRQVSEHNVYRWAGSILGDGATLREHERLEARWSHPGRTARPWSE
ncbi:MAG: trehalose-6-phosphate synthase [Pseudomonadota bacterium]